MKHSFFVILILALGLLAAACAAPVVAPSPVEAPAGQTVPMEATATQAVPMEAPAPGLPNTCPRQTENGCPASCPAGSNGEESCPDAAACPYAGECTAESGCAAAPYNACVDEPACGDVEEEEVAGQGCLVTYDMMQAGMKGVYQKLTASEAKARMESGDPVVILDVRTQSEYEAGHIPGAILIPNETIAGEPLARLNDATAEVLIYCRSGRRSKEAAEKLLELGYTNVYDFGGINDWPYETVTGGEEAA